MWRFVVVSVSATVVVVVGFIGILRLLRCQLGFVMEPLLRLLLLLLLLLLQLLFAELEVKVFL